MTRILQRRTIAIPLYLLNIIICIIISMNMQVIVVLFNVLFAGIVFLFGVFLTKSTIRSRPDMKNFFNPETSYEHIIMPPALLVFIFMPRIISFFMPVIGSTLISLESSNAGLFLILNSFPLGTIVSFPKDEVPVDKVLES